MQLENLVVSIVAEDKATTQIRNISAVFTGLNQALGLAQTAVDITGQVINGTVGEYIQYADTVRTISTLSQQSAEDTSRLVQVSEDLGISQEDLVRINKKLVDEGMTLSIETLGQLSDQFLAIQDPLERSQFLLETFGNTSDEVARMMSLGSEALSNMNLEVDANLILNEEQVESAEEVKKALDDVKDSWEGLMLKIGEALAPVLLWAIDLFNDMVDAVIKAKDIFFGLVDTLTIFFKLIMEKSELFENFVSLLENLVYFLSAAAKLLTGGDLTDREFYTFFGYGPVEQRVRTARAGGGFSNALTAVGENGVELVNFADKYTYNQAQSQAIFNSQKQQGIDEYSLARAIVQEMIKATA